jgi:hypothetical protein
MSAMWLGRRQLAGGAMAAGVAIGLALLGWMAPGEVHAPATEARASVRRDLVVRRQAPAARARRVEAPRAARAVEEEPEGELVDVDDTTGLVVVDVVDEEGRPADDAVVQAVDCPGFRRSGPPGEYRVEIGQCTLRAARKDGAIYARGPEVTVDVGGPDEAYAQLELPAKRFGGIGIRFNPVGVGMQIVEISPGTPAEKAGLEVGDVVVAIGDEEVGGMTARDFIEAMTGPEGSDVEFTVGWASDTGTAVETLKLTRAFLDG